MLSNNLNLLVLICQSPLLNESNSSLPKSILKLLMAYQENEIETFIIRLLSYKARMYRTYFEWEEILQKINFDIIYINIK